MMTVFREIQFPSSATATITGSILSLDFSGSGPQARGAINLPDSAFESVGLLLRKSGVGS